MKCQNCGKNECSFHYTYSINGRTSEVHLCGECAEKLGYSNNVFFNTDSIFEDMVSGFFGRSARRSPFGGFGLLPAMAMMPRIAFGPAEQQSTEQSAKTAAPEQKQTGVDPEISRRRELNMLREQMKQAAEAEDFEKAAELRDKIKQIEG